MKTTDLAASRPTWRASSGRPSRRPACYLIVDCPPLPEPVFVDRDMWEKIVLNLLSNAFKFTFDGEIRGDAAPRGEHVELAISDTGIGIPEDRTAANLRAVPSRRRLTRRARMKARASASPSFKNWPAPWRRCISGKPVRPGNAFRVSFRPGKSISARTYQHGTDAVGGMLPGGTPLVEGRMQCCGCGSDGTGSAISTRTRTGTPVPRILLADDNADMRDYLSGCCVAAWGAGGRRWASRFRGMRRTRRIWFLTDVMMPRLDGFGLLRALSDDPHRTIPVILLSARAGEESRIEGLEQGADDYLIKPFSAHELLARGRRT